MKLYNTMTRKNEVVNVLNDAAVTLYTCGLTVYSQPHIGNWVSYIYWDVLVRTLKQNGFKVTRVQNITDVGHLTSDEDAGEDKMLKSALREGMTAWDVAEKYIAIADDEAYNQLGLLRPDHMPRATQYIPQQIKFITELESKGYTYITTDGVYFDTAKLVDYGKLARLDIEGLQFGSRVADTGKMNPTDFALWKFSIGDVKRDMEWESPWGVGFPGWHLECSVMAREILGDTIDIHTGGIDHIPVHHINEIAQSEAVTGKTFANMWLHANHIKVDGTKMSKSLGNIYTLADITHHGYTLDAFKLMIFGKHYSTEGNFTWDIIEAAQNRLKNFETYADLKHQASNSVKNVEDSYEASQVNRIFDAMNDNLNTPLALQIIQETLEHFMIQMNGIHTSDSKAFQDFLNIIDTLYGLHLSNRDDISADDKHIISRREQARHLQDWDESDRLRDELLERGIQIRDGANGTTWSRA